MAQEILPRALTPLERYPFDSLVKGQCNLVVINQLHQRRETREHQDRSQSQPLSLGRLQQVLHYPASRGSPA